MEEILKEKNNNCSKCHIRNWLQLIKTKLVTLTKNNELRKASLFLIALLLFSCLNIFPLYFIKSVPSLSKALLSSFIVDLLLFIPIIFLGKRSKYYIWGLFPLMGVVTAANFVHIYLFSVPLSGYIYHVLG